MLQMKDIEIGTRLELLPVINTGEDAGYPYISKLQHITDEYTIEIDIPPGNNDLLFKEGVQIQIAVVAKEGIYIFFGKIAGKDKRNQVPVFVIKRESDISKIQRRLHYRLSCNCKVRYRPFKLAAFGPNEEHFKTVTAIDLSGGGMCILTEEKLEKINFLECVIILEKEVEIRIIGKVVSVKNEQVNHVEKWKVSIQFQKINENEREKIISYIFREQARMRRKGMTYRSDIKT